MNLTCPECKNEVDLSLYPNFQVGHIIECTSCGITLAVQSIGDGEVAVEIVDEGK